MSVVFHYKEKELLKEKAVHLGSIKLLIDENKLNINKKSQKIII